MLFVAGTQPGAVSDYRGELAVSWAAVAEKMGVSRDRVYELGHRASRMMGCFFGRCWYFMRELNQSYILQSYLNEVVRPQHHYLNAEILKWAEPVVSGTVKCVAGTLHYIDWGDRRASLPFELRQEDFSFFKAGGIDAWRRRTLPAFAVSLYCERNLIKDVSQLMPAELDNLCCRAKDAIRGIFVTGGGFVLIGRTLVLETHVSENEERSFIGLPECVGRILQSLEVEARYQEGLRRCEDEYAPALSAVQELLMRQRTKRAAVSADQLAAARELPLKLAEAEELAVAELRAAMQGDDAAALKRAFKGPFFSPSSIALLAAARKLLPKLAEAEVRTAMQGDNAAALERALKRRAEGAVVDATLLAAARKRLPELVEAEQQRLQRSREASQLAAAQMAAAQVHRQQVHQLLQVQVQQQVQQQVQLPHVHQQQVQHVHLQLPQHVQVQQQQQQQAPAAQVRIRLSRNDVTLPDKLPLKEARALAAHMRVLNIRAFTLGPLNEHLRDRWPRSVTDGGVISFPAIILHVSLPCSKKYQQI